MMFSKVVLKKRGQSVPIFRFFKETDGVMKCQVNRDKEKDSNEAAIFGSCIKVGKPGDKNKGKMKYKLNTLYSVQNLYFMIEPKNAMLFLLSFEF